MSEPWVTSVAIDGHTFGAVSASVGFSTPSDHSGMPVMGALHAGIDLAVDIHDDKNMPFSTLKKLFDLANVVTREKIKDIKIEFWKDESKQDVICSFRLKGWISNWHVHSGEGGNHMLTMTLQPTMDQRSFPEVTLSN